ncbi:polyprenyl synthetase family protein [Desulfonema magnum]|uniref:Polyprenyl synthetase n=1 Tax=Desulfonema magnum TaxID=45655 RepID=A0A975GU56_9BACT|nr:farnesyl diphosphate synthase [Desulfonema magnum]QTA92833.1 Polyprenyl synthetase [Desulfonema magnum]
MFDLNSYLTSKNKQINNALNEILKQDSTRISAAMRYSLMAGGKRIRPVLCIAGAEAVGGKAEDVLTAACAIEMIHTYSLIHDDLPAMDDDDLRRGKPTCHIAYDEATGILTGDALLTLAFQVLSSDSTGHHASKLLKVINILTRAVGYKGMIEGQMRDVASEGVELDSAALEKIHALKTGALIEASVTSGAILGRGTAREIEHLRIYAKNIGLAFQVMDDILNIEGDPAVLGKAVGTDKIREKSTYPSVMGIEKSKQAAKNMINNALQSLDIFDSKSDPLRALATYIITRKR